MQLYLMRHGVAVDAGPGTTDAVRILSEKGARRTAEAARGLKALGCRPQRVLTSPLARAKQTAEIALREIRSRGQLEIAEALAPGVAVEESLRWVARLHCRSALLVGHMPGLSELASRLLSPASDAPLSLEIKKAGALLISFAGKAAEGAGTLEWFLPPRVLKKLM